jgi:CHAD domain-containing protein
VRSARCQCLLLALAQAIAGRAWMAALDPAAQETAQQALVPYAASILERRYQLVRRRGRNLARLREKQLHRLRLAVKKLRYAVEFFGALFDPADCRRFRPHVSALQDVLGRINDAATAEGMLAGIDDPPQPGLATACAWIAGWNRHEVHRLRMDLAEAWGAFRSAPPFWRAADASWKKVAAT